MRIVLVFAMVVLFNTTFTNSADAARQFKKGYYVASLADASFNETLFFYSNATKVNDITVTIAVDCGNSRTGESSSGLITFGGNEFRGRQIVDNKVQFRTRVFKSGTEYTIDATIKPGNALFMVRSHTRGEGTRCTGTARFTSIQFSRLVPSKTYSTDVDDPNGTVSFTTQGRKVTAIVVLVKGTCDYGDPPYNYALIGNSSQLGVPLSIDIVGGQFGLVGTAVTPYHVTDYQIQAVYDQPSDTYITQLYLVRADELGRCSFEGEVIVPRA